MGEGDERAVLAFIQLDSLITNSHLCEIAVDIYVTLMTTLKKEERQRTPTLFCRRTREAEPSVSSRNGLGSNFKKPKVFHRLF
jgi:hypothetical protein